MMSDMKYLAIPVLGLVFGLLFAQSALAAEGSVCTMEYAPVCAAKQVQCIRAPCYPVYQTYSNSCMAVSDHATLIHAGACTEGETGPVKPTEAYVPPADCTAWFDGCNSCSRGTNGEALCTKKACLVAEPGYCTTYKDAGPAATTTDAESPASSTPPAEPDFLSRVIAWVLHLFEWIR